MKIFFLCGSLEPGKDGVGDYTRRLSFEIKKLGHEVIMASIADVRTDMSVETDEAENRNNISVYRYTNLLTDELQFNNLQKIIAGFEPDFISLQYVPYSFHPSGIALRLGKKLKQLSAKARWHIMVHEPFIDPENEGIKKRLISFLQVISLRLLNYHLKLCIWNTTIPFYQRRLEKNVRISCKILGLFGNIPVIIPETVEIKYDSHTLTAVYFGAVPKPVHHKIFVDKLRSGLTGSGIRLQILFCGKGGDSEGEFHRAIGELSLTLPIAVTVLGKLPAEKISHLFSSADFGIARVAPHLLGKSGSAIAMLEHGLPLWLPMTESNNCMNDIDFRPELCFENIERICECTNHPITPLERLPAIAGTLLKELASNAVC